MRMDSPWKIVLTALMWETRGGGVGVLDCVREERVDSISPHLDSCFPFKNGIKFY